MLITGINVLQATDRSDMVTDNSLRLATNVSSARLSKSICLLLFFRAFLKFHNLKNA